MCPLIHDVLKAFGGLILNLEKECIDSKFDLNDNHINAESLRTNHDNILFYSVLRPFQDYFSSYEMGQSVAGQKQENHEKNHLAHPQAELGWSHMWRVRGSNPHQTQR